MSEIFNSFVGWYKYSHIDQIIHDPVFFEKFSKLFRTNIVYGGWEIIQNYFGTSRRTIIGPLMSITALVSNRDTFLISIFVDFGSALMKINIVSTCCETGVH